jgi:GTPase Era involved in 16S rRNA processing
MQQNATEISNKLLNILGKKTVTKDFFQNEIELIEKRIETWNRNIIRIGIIGITSSGKSTLVNAILGEDILPDSVAPTSGVIVGCMKDDKFHVKINYLNGKIENIKEYKEAKNKLSILADEKNNPNNKLAVNQIEIHSPKFIPNFDDLKILDSPGLNACNLETHEKITYEQLLTEIDICVFLTSLKGNADKDDKAILQKIDDSNREYNKTVIVVQNKLDSVRSKPGRRAGIAKTKEQVISECGERIRLLCEGLKMKPFFCQISARDALNSRLFNNTKQEKTSNINEFIEIISEAYENEKSLRDSKRIKQTARIFMEIIKFINQSINIAENDSPNIFNEEEEIEELKKYYKTVHEKFINMKSNIENSYESWLSFIKERLTDLEINDPYDVKSANKLIANIKNQTEEIRNNNLDEIKKFKRLLNKLFSKFNLIPEDIDFSGQILEKKSKEGFNIETFPETIQIRKIIGTKRVPKPGKGNWLIRKLSLGILGYEEQNEYGIDISTKNKINIKKEKEKIEYLSGKIYTKDESAIKKFNLNFRNQLIEIKKELDNKIKNISDKKNKLMPTEILECIKSELNSILNTYGMREIIESESPVILRPPNNSFKENENPILTYPIPKNIYSLYRLNELKTRYIFDRIWSSVLAKYSDKSKPIVILGWGFGAVTEFSNLFIYNNNINEDKLKVSGFETELVDSNQYIYIDRNRITDDTILLKNLHKYKNSGFNIFTILNVSEEASTENIIKEDKLLTSLLKNKNNKCNWIYKDFQIEINSDSLEEATKLFIEFPNKFNYNTNGCYLINNMNPVYSLMFIEYSKIKNESDSIRIKNEILKNKNIKPYVSNTVKKHSDIISNIFQELNSNNNGK